MSNVPDPAQERVVALLGLVAAEPPESDPKLVEDVMSTVRWQYAVRGLLVAAGELAGALADVLVLALGSSRSDGRPR
jgi:hypothetical protein